MKKAHIFLSITFLFLAGTALSQYPSDAQLISDVKASDPKAFVTVKASGQWKMIHDKVPDWQQPDACERVVDISGNKLSDGTWWSYKAFVIYNKVGGKMVFDRVFLIEDETRLNGVDLPDNSYFINEFISKMNARDPMLLKGSQMLMNATNFYSYELSADPRATGNSQQIAVFATIKVVYDSPSSNTKLAKKSQQIKMKYEKRGDDFIFLFASKSPEGDKFLNETDFGSKDILENIPTFKNSGKTLAEMTSEHPIYPKAKGSNGDGYPVDDKLKEIAESTFLTSADNFKILFGDKGLNMIMEVKFVAIENRTPEKADETHFDKDFYCDYTFFNADDDAKKLSEIVGRREMKFYYSKEGDNWTISNAKMLTETTYIKNSSLNYSSYINTVRAKTYAKRFGIE